MKTIIKNYFMAIVAVMMVIGFSAFKVVERMSDDPEIDWYEVGPSDNYPHNLEIKGLFNGSPISGTDPAECATENSGEICALLLEVGPLAPDLTGREISTLSGLPDVEEMGSASHPED